LTKNRMRIHSLQPGFSIEELLDGEAGVSDQKLLNDLLTVVKVWAKKDSQNLPDFFDSEVEIVSARRQVCSSIVLNIQREERALFPTLVPFKTRKFDRKQWETSDCFELAPRDLPCLFPDVAIKKIYPVVGNEELVLCQTCGGSAQLVCSICDGSGKQTHDTCNGGGTLRCSRCFGAGRHLTGGVNLVTCTACNGSGSVACDPCGSSGSVVCANCDEGAIDCSDCQGVGKMLKRWNIRSEISTVKLHKLYCRSNWLNPNAAMGCDGITLQEYRYALPVPTFEIESLKNKLPPQLFPLARDLLEHSLRPRTDFQIDSGLKLEVQAFNVYRLELQQNGQPAVLLVGGLSNEIVPVQLPPRSKGLVSQVLRGMDSALNLVGLGTRSRAEREFLKLVEAGEIYITDTDLLGPALRNLGVQVEVSSVGYQITLEGKTLPISLGFVQESKEQILLRTTITLGQGDRENFPRALAINQYLETGFIGLVESEDRSRETFVLIDNRYYKNLEPERFLAVLQQLYREANAIIKEKRLL
jgi:hypothetical protein